MTNCPRKLGQKVTMLRLLQISGGLEEQRSVNPNRNFMTRTKERKKKCDNEAHKFMSAQPSDHITSIIKSEGMHCSPLMVLH